MGIFSRNKEAADTSAPAEKSAVAKRVPASIRDLSGVLIRPRVTEKAVKQSEQNVYTFLVRQDASKADVYAAVKAIFNVTPMKVNIVNKTARQFMSRSKGRVITERGQKKAYVYLKKGDTIELV